MFCFVVRFRDVPQIPRNVETTEVSMVQRPDVVDIMQNTGFEREFIHGEIFNEENKAEKERQEND